MIGLAPDTCPLCGTISAGVASSFTHGKPCPSCGFAVRLNQDGSKSAGVVDGQYLFEWFRYPRSVSCETIIARFDALFTFSPNLILDLRSQDILPSYAIGAIILTSKKIKDGSGALRLIVPAHHAVVEVFETFRIPKVVRICDDVRKALASL